MIKKILLTSAFFVCLISFSIAQTQPLFLENFSGHTQTLSLTSANNWTQCATGTNQLTIDGGNFDYPMFDPDPATGLQNAWNSIYFDSTMAGTNVGGYCNTFSAVGMGRVYLAFVYQDSTIHRANTNGDYFITLGSSWTSNAGRILVKYVNGDAVFGVRKATGTDAWGTNSYSKNSSHLLVMVYDFKPNANDDVVRLYVDPALPGPEPMTPEASAPTSDPDFTGTISNLFIRFNMSAADAPSCFIDNILVDTTWENISAAPCMASFTASSSALNATFTNTSIGSFHSFLYDYGDASGQSNIGTHTYATAGTYNVCLTLYKDQLGNNPCDTICQSLTVTSIGINEFKNNFDASVIYQNEIPSLKIVSNNATEIKISLINALGQTVETVYNGSVSAGERRFTTNTKMASGLYFYQIISDKGNKTLKAFFK
jgi:PKD repeat protein